MKKITLITISMMLLFTTACSKEYLQPTSIANASTVSKKGMIPDAKFAVKTGTVRIAKFKVDVLLMGAHVAGTDTMHSRKHDRVGLHRDQPFGIPPYNYGGSESVHAFLNNMVDWVLLEFRDPNNLIVARKAAMLLRTNSVVDAGTGSPILEVPIESEFDRFYVVVHHLSHLPAMSAVPRPTYNYQYVAEQDFTYHPSASFNNSTIEHGYYSVLQGGNANSDKKVSAGGPGNDLSYINSIHQKYIINGIHYADIHPADIDMDGWVGDRDKWFLQNVCLNPQLALSDTRWQKF